MPRQGYERGSCKDCGAKRADVGHITWRGYCGPCGIARHIVQVDQMRAHSGPHFESWRRAMALSVGGLLVDDLLDAMPPDS